MASRRQNTDHGEGERGNHGGSLHPSGRRFTISFDHWLATSTPKLVHDRIHPGDLQLLTRDYTRTQVTYFGVDDCRLLAPGFPLPRE
jgi:hypothetical protein